MQNYPHGFLLLSWPDGDIACQHAVTSVLRINEQCSIFIDVDRCSHVFLAIADTDYADFLAQSD